MEPIRIDRRTFVAGSLATALLPAAARAPTLPFLVLGDWGREGREEQREVGRAMGRVASKARIRFTASVGDNFYKNGVSGADDPQWSTSFKEIYDAPSLQTPWHVIPGNHDYRGNVDAQIRYKGDPRWNMPARYYTRAELLPDGTRVDFFHIDTSPFLRAYLGSKVHIEGQSVDAQLRWLERSLAASSATWRIVLGHHPVLTASAGEHDTPELIAQVKPLLDRYGVNLYFNGHFHTLQETQVDGVTYVTSGAGSRVKHINEIARPGFAFDRHGFVLARLARDAMVLTYVDESGAVLRESTLQRA